MYFYYAGNTSAFNGAISFESDSESGGGGVRCFFKFLSS